MKYFGTDGIRQPADKFTADFLARIIKGLTDYAGTDIKVLLGGDTRESSEWILRDLESACETFGIEYSSVGVLPTPAINYCFYEMSFDFAIMQKVGARFCFKIQFFIVFIIPIDFAPIVFGFNSKYAIL